VEVMTAQQRICFFLKRPATGGSGAQNDRKYVIVITNRSTKQELASIYLQG